MTHVIRRTHRPAAETNSQHGFEGQPVEPPETSILSPLGESAVGPHTDPAEAAPHSHSPLTALEAPHPVASPGQEIVPEPEKRHLSRKVAAGVTVLATLTVAALAGGVYLFGPRKAAEASVEATPVASAPVTPGNTTSPAPSATATASASETVTSSITFGLPESSWSKLKQQGYDRADAAIKLAANPDDAVAAFRKLDKNDQESYIAGLTLPSKYGKQLTAGIQRLLAQNPNALPPYMVEHISKVGAGQETQFMTNDDIVASLDTNLVMASLFAELKTEIPMDDSYREKVVDILLGSLYYKNIGNLNERAATAVPDQSVLFYADYKDLLLKIMNRTDKNSIQLLPLMVYDAEGQKQLIDSDAQGTIVTPDGETTGRVNGIVTRLYGDTSAKVSVVNTTFAPQGGYTFYTVAATTGLPIVSGKKYPEWLNQQVKYSDGTHMFKNVTATSAK